MVTDMEIQSFSNIITNSSSELFVAANNEQTITDFIVSILEIAEDNPKLLFKVTTKIPISEFNRFDLEDIKELVALNTSYKYKDLKDLKYTNLYKFLEDNNINIEDFWKELSKKHYSSAPFPEKVFSVEMKNGKNNINTEKINNILAKLNSSFNILEICN